ncbi:MAG: homoserine dehydrogenase [Pirellulales bacterium]|nr:homoserine dehydrogenase [Pirellulales bacterium]
MEKVKVALVGFGTIGSGVARLLLEEGPRIARGARKQVELAYVVDKDLKTKRNVTLPDGLLSDDLDRALNDPDVEVVVQLVGGTDAARSIMLRALDSGKNVVTANKALLAAHGPELFDKARQLGRTIAFEAAVGGGIPVIATIGQSLTANRIESIDAILNGTCNFILSEMEQHGSDYEDVVAEAQRLGYAEADPTMDVDGSDATQKLAILAQLAFGASVDWKDIPRMGIDSLAAADIQCAQGMGYSIRLVATARLGTAGLELCVAPTFVSEGTPLAGVQGAFNAVQIVGDAVGPLLLHGLGAGQNPTASAVVADLIDTLAGRTAITFNALNLWSKQTVGVPIRALREIPGRFYLRLDIETQVDAVNQIARVLQEHNTAIDSLAQYEDEESEDRAGMVIMTQETTEGNITDAVGQIEKLPFVQAEAVRCRVAD